MTAVAAIRAPFGNVLCSMEAYGSRAPVPSSNEDLYRVDELQGSRSQWVRYPLRSGSRYDGYFFLGTVDVRELDLSVHQSKQSVISSQTYTFTRMDSGSTLPYNNIACAHYLSAKHFGSQSLGITVSTVLG